ncbi:MAG: hypothetical protein ABFD00_08125 [Chloroherpetonaceae bacterium]
MTINFMYNWPPAENSIRISLNGQTIEDKNFVFRLGVIKKNNPNGVYWQGKNWLSDEEISKLNFDIKCGDKIAVCKKRRDTEEIVFKNIWDTERDWPAEASGASTTVIPFEF